MSSEGKGGCGTEEPGCISGPHCSPNSNGEIGKAEEEETPLSSAQAAAVTSDQPTAAPSTGKGAAGLKTSRRCV